MRTHTRAAVWLAMGSAVLAGIVAACGQHASGASGVAGSPHASLPAARAPEASPRAVTASPSPVRGSAGAASSQPSSPVAANSSHESSPLADGLYVDAPDGTPRYVLALSHSGHAAIRGSVTYLYQDGRTIAVSQYTGKLSGDGHLTVVFGNARTLTGTYASTGITLVNCASVLTMASHPNDCQFTYHGHVP